MKVLKFGGTSVADSKSISHVIEIIKKSNATKQVVVVSALGGITNILIDMAEKASRGDSTFKNSLPILEERHLNPIQHFIPVTHQSEIISFLKTQLNNLEELLESLFTLQELTPKSLAKVSSYGEILSSKIIFQILKYANQDVVFKDARELLYTHEVNDREVINQTKS